MFSIALVWGLIWANIFYQQFLRILGLPRRGGGYLSPVGQGNLAQLKAIATQLKSLGMEVNIEQAEPQLKAEVLAQISKAKKQMPDRASTLKNNQRFGVLKQSLKLFLGALVGSTLYYQIWRSVSWVKGL